MDNSQFWKVIVWEMFFDNFFRHFISSVVILNSLMKIPSAILFSTLIVLIQLIY